MATVPGTTFPYSTDRYFAPRTSGVLIDTGDVPFHTAEIPSPGPMSTNAAKEVTLIAEMTDYVGDTTCVRANQINYAQMAGTD